MIEVIQDGMKIVKVEYDVYANLTGSNLVKLNLTICENCKISILTPFKMDENKDKHNSSSGYYNDICYTTTSQSGTDITLKDRQTEYIEKDVVCQDNCEFSDYNYEILKANCSCVAKGSPPFIADMNINKSNLLKNIRDIKKFANLNFLVCYKKLFIKDCLINNISCYIIIAIIFFYIISIFIFSLCDFPLIKRKIKYIILGLNESQILMKNKNDKNIETEDSKKKSKKKIYQTK